jgi:hypothetical protein
MKENNFIKEDGEINPTLNKTFMKEINNDIDKVFFINNTNEPYNPELCKLTY